MDFAGPPHLALFLVLAYLPLHGLLSMSQVCKSLRDAITSDVLVWLDIIIERPLNRRLTDDVLTRITLNANGRLRTLALLNCFKISDDGLLRVLNENPLITKLYVTGCTGLTPEGVLRAVKTLAEKPGPLTTLKINGIYNLKQEHLQTLQSHLPKGGTSAKPRFYHKYDICSFRRLDEEGDRPIDVEICTRCEDVKLVFSCPRGACLEREEKQERECHGCSRCVPRCEGCGRCIIDEEDGQGETICNDTLCLECWLRLPKCNFCNKPFCPRHASEHISPCSGGFVCEACRASL